MRKSLIMAAFFAAATLSSCSNGALNGTGDEPITGETKNTTVTIKTGTYSKSFDPSTVDSSPAKFNDTEAQTFYAYNEAGDEVAVVNQILTLEKSETDHQEYSATLALPTSAKSINVVLNDDNGTTWTGVASTRQGGTNKIAVLIDKTSDDQGTITVDPADASKGSASLILGPEMSRLEMVNDLTDDFFNTTTTVDVVYTVPTRATDTEPDFEATYAQIVSFYGDLQISAYYLDNIFVNRTSTTIEDNNTNYVDPATWVAKYTTSNWTGFKSATTDATIFSTTTGLASDFTALTGGQTSVGFNIFDQVETVPTTADDAKAAHPHFIVEIKYFPATEYSFDKDAGTLQATAWGEVQETAYINLAAFQDATPAFVGFDRGNVYQFNIKDVLSLLLKQSANTTITPENPKPDPETPPTPDPDQKFNVTMTVDVLDWQVTPVTPMPL